MCCLFKDPAQPRVKETKIPNTKKGKLPFRVMQLYITVLALLFTFASFGQNIENSMMEKLEPMSVSSYSHLQVSDLNANNLQLPANWSHKLPPRPPIDLQRIGGELFAGVGTGIIGGGVSTIVGGIVGLLAVGDLDIEDAAAYIYTFTAIGYTACTSLGIYLVGSIGNQTGQYWTTVAGSAIGMVTSVVIFRTLSKRPIDAPSLTEILIVPSISTIGGVIGFNLWRNYENDSELSLNPTSNGLKLTYEF